MGWVAVVSGRSARQPVGALPRRARSRQVRCVRLLASESETCCCSQLVDPVPKHLIRQVRPVQSVASRQDAVSVEEGDEGTEAGCDTDDAFLADTLGLSIATYPQKPVAVVTHDQCRRRARSLFQCSQKQILEGIVVGDRQHDHSDHCQLPAAERLRGLRVFAVREFHEWVPLGRRCFLQSWRPTSV